MTKYSSSIKPELNVIILDAILVGKAKLSVELKMVFDTGASMTTIPIEAAIAIGCDPTKSKKRIEMITASGIEYAPLVTIPAIEFCGFKIKYVDVVCHNLPPNSSVAGLLGMNVLKNFNISLKFLDRIFEITK